MLENFGFGILENIFAFVGVSQAVMQHDVSSYSIFCLITVLQLRVLISKYYHKRAYVKPPPILASANHF